MHNNNLSFKGSIVEEAMRQTPAYIIQTDTSSYIQAYFKLGKLWNIGLEHEERTTYLLYVKMNPLTYDFLAIKCKLLSCGFFLIDI